MEQTNKQQLPYFYDHKAHFKVGCIAFQCRLYVVINKCFLLNPEKNGADSSCRFREKRTFNFEK